MLHVWLSGRNSSVSLKKKKLRINVSWVEFESFSMSMLLKFQTEGIVHETLGSESIFFLIKLCSQSKKRNHTLKMIFIEY